MTAESITAAGRAAAEALFDCTCEVLRPTGETTTDPVTLTVVPVLDRPLLFIDPAGVRANTGRCKVQTRALVINAEESAESTTTVQRLEVHVSAMAGPFEPFDVIRIVSSEQQPHLVGLRARGRAEATNGLPHES